MPRQNAFCARDKTGFALARPRQNSLLPRRAETKRVYASRDKTGFPHAEVLHEQATH